MCSEGFASNFRSQKVFEMKAAIFDLDGTLIRFSGERRFLPWMILRLKLNPLKFVPFLVRSLKDGSFYSTKLYYRGEKIEKIERLAHIFFSPVSVQEMVFREGKREIESLREEGYKLILLTGAPYFIADNFKILGFDIIIPSYLEARNGKLTGELITYPSGKKKREIILNLSKELFIDLSSSKGYGNSYEDREFLSLLGFPVAVNPSFRLKKFAERMGWEIRYWR